MRMTMSAEEQRAFFLLMDIPGGGVDLCNEESLKKAFRSKAKKSHPDLAAHMGKDPRLMKLRFQELNDAFNILMERVQKEQAPYTARQADPVKPAPKAKAKPATKTTAKTTAKSATKPATKTTAKPANKASAAKNKASSTGKTTSEKKKGDEIFYSGKTPGRNLRFAEYLYYSGYISWTDLVQALVWQYRNRPKLGELATDSGLLDFAEVLEVIRAKNPYELFGEAAVRLGYLSPSKLNTLVREQKKMACPIGHYFTSSKLMTSETLHKKLMENRRHNNHFTDGVSDS